jgi:hypothetical protein
VAVCGSTVSGPASVTGAAGPVLLGGASGTPCPADTVTGVVNLIGNVGDVTLGGATINGPAHIAGNGGRGEGGRIDTHCIDAQGLGEQVYNSRDAGHRPALGWSSTSQ